MAAVARLDQSQSTLLATTPTSNGFHLSDKQAEVNHLLSGPQRHTLLVGGGRSGKTFLICRAILIRALRGPGSRHLITRLHFNHVRASIWLDTLPKVARLCFPGLVLDDRRQDSYVAIPRTGSEIWFGGLDEKERVDKILGQEYCLDPDARVLTADLRWVAAKDIVVGQEIIGFPDALVGHTKLKRSVVEWSETIISPRYRLTTDRGETIVSAGHKFACYYDDRRHKQFTALSWRAVEDLNCGDKLQFSSAPWDTDQSWKAGWLAGILDGEGWVSQGKSSCGVGQNPGSVLDAIESALLERNIPYWRSVSSACVQLGIKTIWEAMRLIGSVRPKRLMQSSNRLWEDRRGFIAGHGDGSGNNCGRNHSEARCGPYVATVVAVERLKDGPVVALQTSTRTLIADGFLGHNCSIFINEVSQISYNSVLVARTRLAQQVPLAKGGYLPIRAYYDLNPVGRRHWSHLEFFDKRSPVNQNPLAHPEQFAAAYLNPVDNAENLPPETLQEYDMLPERQRMRFFLGQYSSEIEGALWTFESLDHARCLPSEVPVTMRRVVVAVDPSGTAGDEETRSDDVGIIVAGRGDDGNAYVLADRTCNLPPEAWARVVMTAYHEFRADHVVGEANFGGDMVRALIHSVDRNIKYYPVVASRGKAVRAEPVSAFYGHEVNGEWVRDRVKHAGEFRQLEAELMDFSAAGYLGVKSPNRADALVWALTDLLVDPVQPNLWSQSDVVLSGPSMWDHDMVKSA